MGTLDETAIFNVALIPPVSVALAVSEYSRQLEDVGGTFVVDNASRMAHMTLFMARMPISVGNSVTDAVAALSGRSHPLQLRHTGFFVTSGLYYEASYVRTADVLKFHFDLVEALAPVRYSPGRPLREPYFGPYSAKQRVNAIKFGYDLVGQLFRPHITITRFRFPPCTPIPTSPSADDLSFVGTRIGIFRADNLGAARSRIAEVTITE